MPLTRIASELAELHREEIALLAALLAEGAVDEDEAAELRARISLHERGLRACTERLEAGA
jgi:hypothetical protein